MILISDAFTDALPKRLAKFGDVTTDASRASDATIVIVRSKTQVTRAYIDAAPKLALVIRGGVGLDNVDVAYAEEKNIAVFNTADASTIAVAELALALMLALASHIVPGDRSMHEGKWLKKELTRTELHGKVLGVLGIGRIGNAVAERAGAFGMRVVAWHPRGKSSPHAEVFESLEDVLGMSDYVSLHLPLVSSTEGLIDETRIARMKDGAILINTGRGGCIDESAVAAALETGKLAGFGNDVWLEDPPKDSPLVSAPNCICLPHIGASTEENMARIEDCIVDIVGDHVRPGAG